MQFRSSFAFLATVVIAACATGTQYRDASPSIFHVNQVSFTAASAFTYERIDKNNAILLVVDLQEGLYQMARDMSAVQMKNNILAHAELGKVFGLPTILTTSSETGESERLSFCTLRWLTTK